MNTIDSTESKVRTTFERNQRALSLRPALGQGTAVTRVRARQGLLCEISEGSWKLLSDLSEKSGGCNAGPNPGILGRAALGSCLAMGYLLWAAHRGVPLASLEVEVQADYDSRAMYGVAGGTPGYREIRYVVRVESSATEAEIVRLLDEADAHSDFLHVFREPQQVRRELRISAPGGA
jgi:uncharacterized OsmC-like protein